MINPREYLINQGVWENETDEILEDFSDEVTEDDLKIVRIYDSPFELANTYINNVIGELDHHVAAVLDYIELGKHLACSCDEYFPLKSGRIIEFQL